MFELFGKLFVKNYKDVKDKKVRESWGTTVSVVGIIANILLFAGKFTVGLLFKVVSISADAFNNLSDAGSQLISLVSFKISAKPADRDHPFGHARFEYIASMVVSVIIVVIGYSTFKESVDKLRSGEQTTFAWISVFVLIASIGVKLFLCVFNKRIGKRIDSTVMEATASDSLSDCIATGAVLIAQIIYFFFDIDLDAYLGIVVAVIIVIAGIKILHEMIDLLLGEAPDAAYIKEITNFVLGYEGVLGVHDMLVHGYGPNATFVSLHVEVDGSVNVFTTHDIIDNIENDMFNKMGIYCSIHMDPIVTDDEEVTRVRALTADKIKEIDAELKIHDFRFVRGDSHTNLIFDIVAPFELKMSDSELKEKARQKIKEADPCYNAVVKIDRGNNG